MGGQTDVCGTLGRHVRLIAHMLLVRSRVPAKDSVGFSVCSMMRASGVNTALYPLSQNCAMDNRALLPISGKRWHLRAAMGMCGMSKRAVCVAVMDILFGNLTVTP